MIKNIVFDLGGVVLTDENAGFTFENDETKALLKADDNKLIDAWSKYWKLVGKNKIAFEEFYDKLQEEITGNVNKNLSQRLIEIYKNKTHPLETYNILPKLKVKYRLYGLTNITDYGLKYKRKRFLLDSYFNLIVSSSEEGVSKPDLKIFRILINKTGIVPRESLFVDNMEKNMKPAQELGFKTILFKNKEQMIEEMEKFGIEI